MSIIDTISQHIPESVLDQVYRLSQSRITEINEHGRFVATWPNRQSIKALKEGDIFHFVEGSPVKVGTMFNDSDTLGYYVITEITANAGRISAKTDFLPAAATVSTLTGNSQDPLGNAFYRMKPTNWVNIPCSAVTEGKVFMPESYRPDPGDVLNVGGPHVTGELVRVTRISLNAPYCICTVAPL